VSHDMQQTQGMTEVETIEAPETPEIDRRRGVRWYHVAVLGIAVLVAAAGIEFFVSQSGERDDATGAHTAAQRELVSQRAATTRAKNRLATERDQAKATLADVQQLTSALHEFTDLAAQEIDSVNTAHQLAVSNTDAIDEYNAAVDQGNALLTLIEAKGQEIQTLADTLRKDTQAQTAAFTRP
jgi:hypothetical protein